MLPVGPSARKRRPATADRSWGHRLRSPPDFAIGEGVGHHRPSLHLGPGSRLQGCLVVPGLDPHRRDEVLVEMVDVLDPATVQIAADRDEVEHRQVLDDLAQADTAGVWADPDTVLGRQQEDGDVLVHPADPAGVDLRDVDRVGLEQLLEDDAVLDVLARCDGDRRDRARPELARLRP
jgi:hypothetical protein